MSNKIRRIAQQKRKRKRQIAANYDKEILTIWKIYRNKYAGGNYIEMLKREAYKKKVYMLNKYHIIENINVIENDMIEKLKIFKPPYKK